MKDQLSQDAAGNLQLQIDDITDEKANNDILSDAWNASTTYAVGQYCIYNNSLWKCLVQHSGQTPTEGTYWTNVSVANEIISVNNSLGKISLDYNNAITITPSKTGITIDNDGFLFCEFLLSQATAPNPLYSITVNNSFTYYINTIVNVRGKINLPLSKGDTIKYSINSSAPYTIYTHQWKFIRYK